MLLECGIDVSMETKEGEVASDLADTGGHYEVGVKLTQCCNLIGQSVGG